MKKWVLYTLTLGFATYWASNLLLWFPWSYSITLGIVLMLTIAPTIARLQRVLKMTASCHQYHG